MLPFVLGYPPEEELLQQIVEETGDIDNLKRQEVVFNFGTNIATKINSTWEKNGDILILMDNMR